MQTAINGNKFTITATFSRWKVAVFTFVFALVMYAPYYFLKTANSKITQLEKRAPTVSKITLPVVSPVVSPYALSTEAKKSLNEWLLFGMNNGYDQMLTRYSEVTKNDDNYKPFLYVVETEWRLGHWETIPKKH